MTFQMLRRPGLLAAALWLPLAALGAPLPEPGVGMPRDVSSEGWRIDRLVNMTLVIIAGLFAIMVAWMLWTCLRHGRDHATVYSPGDSRRAATAKVGVALAIFLGVDGNLFVHSTRDMGTVFWSFERVEADPRAVRVEINAHQWCWDVRHAGADGRFATPDDILSLNELRVPEGAPVLLQLGATDVIHSLYIPNLRIKQDIVPGTITRAWFQAQVPGEYDIGCAQHCGVHHYKMKGRLIVLPAAEYERWAKDASAWALRGHDPADTDAAWGWEWRRK